MKKLLLSFSLVFVVCTTNAQNLTSENFDVFPTTWTKVNMSSPVGTNLWGQAASAQSTYFVGGR